LHANAPCGPSVGTEAPGILLISSRSLARLYRWFSRVLPQNDLIVRRTDNQVGASGIRSLCQACRDKRPGNVPLRQCPGEIPANLLAPKRLTSNWSDDDGRRHMTTNVSRVKKGLQVLSITDKISPIYANPLCFPVS